METTSNLDLSKYKPQKKEEFYKEDDLSTDSKKNEGVFWEKPNRTFIFKKLQRANVYDIASYILNKKGQMTTMKLHKLLYYAQAWSLVWDEEPLFAEEIQAWANGPVIKDLFQFHRGQFTVDTISIGNPKILTDKQKETVDSVLNYYGEKSSQWLIQLTHLEEPWKQARIGLSPTERSERVISLESMANYYSAL